MSAPALRWTWNRGLRLAALGRGGRLRRLGHRDRERVFLGVRPGLLMRRPRPGYRLAGDLEVVHQLGPGPDGRALAGLGRVLDQFVQAGIAPAMPAGLDPHGTLLRPWTGHPRAP